MIGAPSDIQEEIQIAKNVIHRWNVINSEYQRRVLLPLHWSDNAYPLAGEHPQKTIDNTVVVKSDLLICIFCSRLGSPTDTHKSGSLEEIDEHLKSGKDVMLFFKKNGPSPQNEQELEQLKELMEYKKSIQKNILWWEYNNSSEFENLLREKLGLSHHHGGRTQWHGFLKDTEKARFRSCTTITGWARNGSVRSIRTFCRRSSRPSTKRTLSGRSANEWNRTINTKLRNI